MDYAAARSVGGAKRRPFRPFVLLLLLLGLAGLCGFAVPARAGDRAAVEVVTDLPLAAALVASVGGAQVVVTPLIDRPVSPHDFTLTPSLARRVAHADLVVVTSAWLSPWLIETAADLAAGAPLLILFGPGEADPALAEATDGQADAAGNPRHGAAGIPEAELLHPWLDPARLVRWPERIAATLGARRPDARETFGKRAAALSSRIAAQDRRIAAELAPYRDVGAVISHDFLAPFVRHYGLAPPHALAGAEDLPPTPRRIARARRLLARGEASCLLVTPWDASALPARLAAESGRPLVVVDPVGLTLPPGPDLPGRLLADLARAWRRCAGAGD